MRPLRARQSPRARAFRLGRQSFCFSSRLAVRDMTGTVADGPALVQDMRIKGAPLDQPRTIRRCLIREASAANGPSPRPYVLTMGCIAAGNSPIEER